MAEVWVSSHEDKTSSSLPSIRPFPVKVVVQKTVEG